MKAYLGGAIDRVQLQRTVSCTRGDIYNHPTSPTCGYMWDEEEGGRVSKTKWSGPPLSVSKTVYYMCKREVIETSTQDRPGNEARSEYTWSGKVYKLVCVEGKKQVLT